VELEFQDYPLGLFLSLFHLLADEDEEAEVEEEHLDYSPSLV